VSPQAYTMRLLALDDYELENGHLALRVFSGTDIPSYAILSHRWTDDEVLFKDIENDTSIERAGYPKLRGAIGQAREDGFAYLWDDTCCIDKSSSAELSEAINSMWVWYRDAAVCYTYFCDVSTTAEDHDFEAQVRSSGWFTRGWTLQELIAPKGVNFYNETLAFIGTRQTLHQTISETTGIDADYLNHARPLSVASIAKRMSWAAHRQTTRLEDIAYCLMGLFSVNMAMLYGEGSRAFQRLQEEILRISDDESIFAWVNKDAKSDELHGLLADSPLHFQDSRDIGPRRSPHPGRKAWQTTNMGLNIQRSLISGQMPLLCNYRGRAGYLSVATTPAGHQYARCHLAELQGCMHLTPDGNLFFPQVILHSDRYHPLHETIIRYSFSVSTRTTQNGMYVHDMHSTGMHPMHNNPHSDMTKWNPSKVFRLPKFGTFIDLNLNFWRPVDQTWVFIFLGVVDSKELGLVAGVGSSRFAVMRNTGSVPSQNNEAFLNSSNSRFAKSAVPLGSVVDVGNLHRVSIRQLSTGSNDSSDTNNQVKRLEVDIMALHRANPAPNQTVPVLNQDILVQSEVHSKHSCCRVQRTLAALQKERRRSD
jgi:hypothetical protein